jgi:hypothetical protein
VRGGRLLDARDLQAPPWKLTKRQAYAVLETVGVRISARRLVALPEVVERFFRGEPDTGEVMPTDDNGAGNGTRPPTDAASRA